VISAIEKYGAVIPTFVPQYLINIRQIESIRFVWNMFDLMQKPHSLLEVEDCDDEISTMRLRTEDVMRIS